MDDGWLVELVRRAAAGWQDAFAELYNLTAARVHGVVVQVVRSQELASEVGQDVFIEVWRRCPGYDAGRGSVAAWMVTIAHRRVVDRLGAAASTIGRVWSGLERLFVPQRDALMLAYFQGYTLTQVADRLQVPLGMVKTRMRDGLAVWP